MEMGFQDHNIGSENESGHTFHESHYLVMNMLKILQQVLGA